MPNPVVVVEAGGERRVYPLLTIARRADPRGIWETEQRGAGLRFTWQDGDPATAWVEFSSGRTSSNGPGGAWPRVHHAAWFAWYATHPDDPVEWPR